MFLWFGPNGKISLMFSHLREESSFQFRLTFNFYCQVINNVKDTIKGSHCKQAVSNLELEHFYSVFGPLK